MKDDLLVPHASPGEDEGDTGIRPKYLHDFQGQSELKDNMSIFISAARERNEPLDHVFISGPPGLGKTTLANIMANELGSEIKVTSAPALDKPKDLAGLLSTIPEKTVFFIDEIHRLKPAIEEMLYIAMEDYELDWIIGQGWDEGAWADHYPDKTLLSQAVPDHPVFMRSLHSFAGWGNQMALDLAGIHAGTPVPSGGEMRLGEDGKPSGLFLNRAVPLLESAIPQRSQQQLESDALAGLNRMAADGFVTIHDAGLNAREMEVLSQLESQGGLPIRVYAMVSVREVELARQWLERGPDTDNDSMLVTRSIKAFYDGALGSRGARLLEDYNDMPGHAGVSGDDYGFDEALTADLMRAGFQVGIHAIGDAGIRETLDFLQGVMQDRSAAKGRHRIEHCQVVHPADLPRLGEMRVIASMQPPHAMEDKAWVEQRLGAKRVEGAYAWRSLRREGVMLVFSSDNPGSDHSIFYGLHSAVTRRDKEGRPIAGWYPTQALNIDEAVRAYTRWAAFAGFREGDTGIIQAGRWADLTVMDIDPFVLSEADPHAILDGRILMTVVAGQVIYEQ